MVEALLPLVQVGCEEEVHQLATEPRRRPEPRAARPRPSAQAGLLLKLAPRGLEWLLALLTRAGRQLEQLLARRLAQLANEDDAILGVGRDDRHRAGVLDDLALVVAPALHGDADESPVIDDPRVVRPHRASRSTSRRCSSPNHGGDPAATLARACAGSRVAGIATSTRSSDSTHFSSACAQVSTPNARSGSSSEGDGARRRRPPSANGRITITASPSSAASGSSSASLARS